MIVSTELTITVAGVPANADSLPTVTSCTPSATTSIALKSTGVYTLSITDAVAETTYVIVGPVVVGGVTYTWTKSIVTPAATTVATITITAAIAFLRRNARNAANSSETDSDKVVDAIQTTMDIVAEKLKQPLTSTTVTLTASTAAFSVSAADFRPDLLTRAYIVGETDPLDVVDMDDVLFADAYSGTPGRICFTGFAAGIAYPTPSAAATMKLYYRQPMPAFSSSSGSVVIPLPDDLVRIPLLYGATALLQHTDPEAAYASESWGKFQQWLAGHSSGRGVRFDTARIPE